MKIAILDLLSDPYAPGQSGLGDVAWGLGTALKSLKNEVHIVAPYKSEDYPDKEIKVHTFEIPPMGRRNIIGNTFLILKALPVLKKINDVDIIQCLESHSAGILGMLIKDTPVVLRAPGNIYDKIQNDANEFDFLTTQILKLASKTSCKYCKHIVTISNDQVKWWRYTGAEPSKITMLPNGVNITRFRPIPDSRKTINLDPASKIVLYVGRFTHEKGVPYLLEAIQKIKDDFKDIQLHLVGGELNKSSVISYSRRLGIENHIFFHGYADKEKLTLFYNAADVVVAPSLTEARGRVLPEAMACKRPVIGSSVGGIPDYVKDGVTGFLVPSRDAEALSIKIQEILKDEELAKQLGENAYNYVHENLTWENIARRYQEEVYRPMANKE